ncbi:MAG: hypothetical protein JF606_09930 [Burkholderiales bacterium]|jgi:hypothetical protein|nr:hypothetical protein [Burkholderiales bacterium]
MSSIQSFQPGIYTASSLSTLSRAEVRPSAGNASAWLDGGASTEHGGQQVLHVSTHDPHKSVDQIEQDFIVALCGGAQVTR